MKKLQFLSYILPPKLYLKLAFWLYHQKFLNLRNPTTLNEKIQSLKFYNFKSFHTSIADKLLVRKYVEEKIGKQYLIELIGSFSNPNKIDFDVLPKQFAIKSNHGSSQVKIVKDKNKENHRLLIATCKKWLKQDHWRYTQENQYKDINKKILIEKLITDREGNHPKDYKFHCINGNVEFINVDINFTDNPTRIIYDRNWQKMSFSWSVLKNGVPKWSDGEEVSTPKNLTTMIEISEKLAKDFPYCRIDLYNTDEQIYFGEITLHHGSGWQRFTPERYDKYFGEKLKWTPL